MSTSIRKLSGIVLAVASLAWGASAQAQAQSAPSGAASRSDTGNWYAPAGNRYIGLNAGRSDFSGTPNADAYHLYGGATWGQNFGLEFGATDFGQSGDKDAYAFSLSAVGRIPLTEAFTLFGKLGAMYSRTDQAGTKDDHWGETYALGVDFNVTPQLAAVLEYDRSKLRFAGSKEYVNMTMVGLKYRY